MRRIRHLRTTRQIIQPIQRRALRDRIHPPKQQIHAIRLPAPETLRQLPSHETRHRARSQIRLVAHRVECDVGLDEFGELHRVAGLAAEGHDGGGGELARFVVGGLENRGAAHGGFGGGDYGEVEAGEAEEDFPGWVINEGIERGLEGGFVREGAYMLGETVV